MESFVSLLEKTDVKKKFQINKKAKAYIWNIRVSIFLSSKCMHIYIKHVTYIHPRDK